LLGDKDLAVRLGAQGREHAVQNFSMQVNAQAYTELYRSLSAGIGS